MTTFCLWKERETAQPAKCLQRDPSRPGRALKLREGGSSPKTDLSERGKQPLATETPKLLPPLSWGRERLGAGPRPVDLSPAKRSEAKRRERERETERESHFGSSRPAAVLLVRGALGDGPPGGQRVVSASLAGGRYPEWGEA